MWRVVWRVSRDDLIQRYVRSKLGPIWITIGSAAYIFGLGAFWSFVFNFDLKQFLPFMAVGLIIWQFLIGVVSDGLVTFKNGASIITGMAIPLGFHVLRQTARQLFTFAHTLPVALITVLVFDAGFNANTWLLLPGLLLLFANCLWVSLFLGIIGTRYDDLSTLVRMISPFFFFVTPILWQPEQLGPLTPIINFNPFYHFIELVRAPILGEVPLWENYIFVICATLVGWVVSILLFARAKHRIAFWL